MDDGDLVRMLQVITQKLENSGKNSEKKDEISKEEKKKTR